MSNGTTDALPNVMAVATATNYGRFVIGPMEAGIGTPLGNALRRILLSSLPGSAVTSVRIQNVYHEFSCIPNVREDVTEIVLNVKNVRLRSYSDRPVRLQLSKYGPGEVRAGDIDLPANVELVNPDQVLATLDSTDAHFEMELTVERGRGYVSFESRDGLPIGTIPVDAVFSPIPKVNYVVEPAGIELLATSNGDTDAEDGATTHELDPSLVKGKEQVVIEIWTDGTIDPGESLSLSAQYLAQHSSLIAGFNRVVAPQPRDTVGVAIPPHLFEMSIEDLNLSMRTYNCLKRSGVTKVGQVLRMDKKELLGLRNFGEKSYDELYLSLSSRDLIPPGTPLDISAGEPVEATGEGDGDEDNEGEGEDSDFEVGYASIDVDGDHAEPDVFMAEPTYNEDGLSEQVVHPAGVSEASMEMAAGILVDNEIASSGMDTMGEQVTLNAHITSAPVSDQIVPEVLEEDAEAEAQPTRAKKSRAKNDE